MRKTILMLLVISVLSMSMIGCFGQFSLTRQLYNFNQEVSQDKFVRSIVMWCMWIIPVYSLAMFVDGAILNVIEFWTNTNPLAMNEGDLERQLITYQGVDYEVVATKNRFDISALADAQNSLSLVFCTDDNSWTIIKEGRELKITQQEGDELKLFNLDGDVFATIMNR